MKPIVVLMPGKERETLRECGVLPFDFFSPDNPSGVKLWPNDIDYEAGTSIAATIAEKPGDVPVFFGYNRSTSSSEVNERTCEIVKILNSVMVHVIFLDDKDADGRIEYGHFGSFGGIVEWSQSLMKVLKVRFVNEVDLLGLENVLVVVVRGQQVKITEKERADFSELVGESSRNDIKPFRSCYFLNHELSIDSGLTNIYAENVWDILVARLLKAFVLSREQNQMGANSTRSIWMRPGVKVWKAEECEPGGVAELCRADTENALSAVDALISEARDDDGVPDTIFSQVASSRPDAEVETSPCRLPPGCSWYAFDPLKIVDGIVDSPKRKASIESSATVFARWKRHSCVVDAEECSRVFSFVKESPARIFSTIAKIDKVLAREDGRMPEYGKFKAKVGELVETERRRRDVLEALVGDGDSAEGDGGAEGIARSLRNAQRHYVGFGIGLCVVTAIASMFGWMACQAANLLDCPPFYAAVVTATVVIGSVAALLFQVTKHFRNGSRGTDAFFNTCADLDEISARRANIARGILCDAVEQRTAAMRRSSRMHIRYLLDRIGKVLVHELHYAPAVVALTEPLRRRTMSDFMKQQREEYLSKTHAVVELPVTHVRTDPAQGMIVDLWWNHDGAHLRKLWNDFCRKYDTQNTGNLPVSVFIPMIRSFMARFVKAARTFIRMSVNENCLDDKLKGVKKWFAESATVLFYSAKAAVNPRADQQPRAVFVPKDEDPRYLDELKNCDTTVGSQFFESDLLAEFDTSALAMSYHEVCVTIERDESGVLKLRQAAQEEVRP